MNRLRSIFIVTLLFCCSMARAQIIVDKPLEFVGTDEQDRQLLGLPDSATPQAVLSTGTEQAGGFRTAAASGVTSWSITLPSLSGTPGSGMHVLVLAPSPTSGAVSLSVNGNGPFPVLLAVDQPFDASEVITGTPLSMVFDGTAFHVLNGRVYARKPCATGTIAVNDQFCIQPVEHTETDFFSAVMGCQANGLRLCNWTEFVVACNKAPQLGLTGMLGNWEWADDAVNENGTARLVGSTTCATTGTGLVTGSTNRGWHCCHTR